MTRILVVDALASSFLQRGSVPMAMSPQSSTTAIAQWSCSSGTRSIW